MLNTNIIPHSQNVPPSRWNEESHIDPPMNGQDVVVHILQFGEGERWPSSYTIQKYLRIAAKKNFGLLKKAVDGASKALRKEFRLDALLAQYSGPQESISYTMMDTQDSLMHLRDTLKSPGQNMHRLPELSELYSDLCAFYSATARDAQRYIHPWTNFQHSTVFSYQDTEKSFTSAGLETLSFHRREESPPDEEIILGENYPADEGYLEINAIVRNQNGSYKLVYTEN